MTDSLECKFCTKKFSTKYSLALHIKTAVYCLKLREEELPGIMCEHCGQEFTRLDVLQTHSKTCKTKLKKQEDNKTLNLEKIIISQKHEIGILKESEGLDKIIFNKNHKILSLNKIISEKNHEISNLKKSIKQFKQNEKNFELEKQLAFEKGRVLEASKPKIIAKNYKCKSSTRNKLMNLPTENIKPFTVKTIKDSINGYTYDDYLMGTRGVVKFLKSLILMTNEHGELERNYVCTDPSRNNYYRLEETKEWDSDRGALFIENVIDELKPLASEYFNQVSSKAVNRTDTFERDYHTNLLEELKPFHWGLSKPNSKERATLLTNIRTGIKASASI